MRMFQIWKKNFKKAFLLLAQSCHVTIVQSDVFNDELLFLGYQLTLKLNITKN
jgi:hypothetical protein